MLIVIAVLVGLYYFISPYENCKRDYPDKRDGSSFSDRSIRTSCSGTTNW